LDVRFAILFEGLTKLTCILRTAARSLAVHGVSTRKVDELMKALGLEGVSKSEVSRIQQAGEDIGYAMNVWIKTRRMADRGKTHRRRICAPITQLSGLSRSRSS
jgi:hypothetical protein